SGQALPGGYRADECRRSATKYRHVYPCHRTQARFRRRLEQARNVVFFVGDLRKSRADCDEVMKRNPYHFGALAGYAQIYVRLEYYDRALEYSRRALGINPNLDGVRRNIGLIEHLLEQRRKQMI